MYNNQPNGAPRMETLTQATIESNPLFRPLVCQLDALTRAVAGPEASFKTLEGTALRVGDLALRAVLEKRLQAVSDSLAEAEDLLVDGEAYHRHEEGEVTYHSLCGPLTVRRCTYRKSDQRNGPTVVPLELACTLVERATPALGYSVILGYAQGELRSYAEAQEAAYRSVPSRLKDPRISEDNVV